MDIWFLKKNLLQNVTNTNPDQLALPRTQPRFRIRKPLFFWVNWGTSFCFLDSFIHKKHDDDDGFLGIYIACLLWISSSAAFVTGYSLILLVIEAGIDVDVSSLRLIGTRGVLIAFVGSLLPISIGIILAVIIQAGGKEPVNATECLAAGATFGPTSVGVALSLLRSGGLLNTPVGQLIIAAAVIDDMIALIVLSQLESLNNDDATTNAWTVLSPIVMSTVF